MRRLGQEKLDKLSQPVEGADGKGSMLHVPLSRRRLIGNMLLVGAGTAAFAGFSRPEVARAGTANAGANTITRGGNTVILGPILAPDGFPQASIQGAFVGVRGAYCMVNAGSSVVPVTILPSTQVLAGSAVRNGDLTALSVGDRVFIFTIIVESGERVAVTIEQNPRLYDLAVSTITASQIQGTTVASDATPGLSLQLAVNVLTRFAQLRVPQVGDTIRAATITDSATNQVTAMNVFVLG